MLAQLTKSTTSDVVEVWPLGQSGVALKFEHALVLIDLYLSNYCEGVLSRPFDHRRLTRAPLDPAEITVADVILCSHDHLDHLDVPTIRTLADASPRAVLIVPLSAVNSALALDWPVERVIGTRAGDVVDVAGLTITAFGVPHEEYDEDPEFGHPYQGYAISNGKVTVAHTGDARADDVLAATLRSLSPDLVCLPINGRDEERARMGFAGNMTAAEAIELVVAAEVRRILPMHDDMFAQNIDVGARSRFESIIANQSGVVMVRPRVGESASIRPTSELAISTHG